MSIIHKTFAERVAAVLPPVTITPEQLAAIAAQVPGGLTINQIKSDTDLADAINKKHILHSDDQNLINYVTSDDSRLSDSRNPIAHIHTNDHVPMSDNQDLSGLQSKETGKGLSANDLTIELKTGYDSATSLKHSNSLDHSNASDHSHSNKSTLDTYTQTDVNLADAVSKKHSNILDHNGGAQDTAIASKNPVRLFANLTTPVASSGATEKVLLQLMIPAARAIVGSTFRAWVVGNSSTNGTLIFRIKCGANGSISDTEDWKSVTSVAQVANARAGFEVLITVRSATTIAVDGVGYAGAVQLPTTIAAPATPAIVISGNWYINMTVVCSSGTFTAQVGSIEEIR